MDLEGRRERAGRSFYEEAPFPNYDDLDSPESLRLKAERGVFARLLTEQIPFGSRILECGCGTGQLSNFPGLTWGRALGRKTMEVEILRAAQEVVKKTPSVRRESGR